MVKKRGGRLFSAANGRGWEARGEKVQAVMLEGKRRFKLGGGREEKDRT